MPIRAAAGGVLVHCVWGPRTRPREVVQNGLADVVWYEDVEQAVQAQRNGEVVLAVDLSRQRLKTLPPDLMLLHDLTYLIVSRNRLDRFPIGLQEKTDLKALVADHNRIQDFPEVLLLKMPHVEQLSMGDNELKGHSAGHRHDGGT